MERYWLIGGGAVLVVLLVASASLALTRGETQFEPNSPEYAVQQYVRALVREEFEAAETMWSPDLQQDCSVEVFVVDARRSLDNLSEARITLDDAKTVGETTIVSLNVIRTTGGDIFGPSEYENTYDFGAQKFDGDWRISGHTWPSDRCIRSHFLPEP
jgi:hypothetical protein